MPEIRLNAADPIGGNDVSQVTGSVFKTNASRRTFTSNTLHLSALRYTLLVRRCGLPFSRPVNLIDQPIEQADMFLLGRDELVLH